MKARNHFNLALVLLTALLMMLEQVFAGCTAGMADGDVTVNGRPRNRVVDRSC